LTAERLQKLLSACGYGSRRDCEKFIADQSVKINGKIAKLGDKADLETDQIRILGKLINSKKSPKTYIALNKPTGVLSDIKDAKNRKTVTDLVDINDYVFIVGRLDYRSEGLILLTNDGDVANKLTHPRYQHEKEYHVLINRKPSAKQLELWRNGVHIKGGYKTLPADVENIRSSPEGTWLRIVLSEGKKRQIREVGKSLGLEVKRIIRTRIGPIELGALIPGQWRYLTDGEIRNLKEICSV